MFSKNWHVHSTLHTSLVKVMAIGQKRQLLTFFPSYPYFRLIMRPYPPKYWTTVWSEEEKVRQKSM